MLTNKLQQAQNSNLNTIPSIHGGDSVREDKELGNTQPVPDILGIERLGPVASPEIDSDEEEDPSRMQLHKSELL